MRHKGWLVAALAVFAIGFVAAMGWVEERRVAGTEVAWSPLYQHRVADSLMPVTSQVAYGAAAFATSGCDWYWTFDCSTLGCEEPLIIESPTQVGPTCDTCDAAGECEGSVVTPDATAPGYTLTSDGMTCAYSTCYCPTIFEITCSRPTCDGPTCGGPTCEGETCFLERCDVLDYGDAPEVAGVHPLIQYPTRKQRDGARHVLDGVFYLGARVDPESDGKPSDLADADDSEPYSSDDDEDGIWFPMTLNPGQQATVIVSASQPGTLFAWVDFDGTGSWREISDNVFPAGQSLGPAYNWVDLSIPQSAVASPLSFVRFRFVGSGRLEVSGQAENGEVEDYRVPISASFRAWVMTDNIRYAPGDPVKISYYVNEAAQISLVRHGADGAARPLWTSTVEAGRRLFPEYGGGLVADLPAGTNTLELIATSLRSGTTVWLTSPYDVRE